MSSNPLLLRYSGKPDSKSRVYKNINFGLKIPLVYNANGYDSLETLKLLHGIIDIYLPDIKYSDDKISLECSDVKDYATHSKKAIMEMKRQVGNLEVDDNGIAIKGLIIRHLVLPNGLAGTRESLNFISEEIGRETFMSLMWQYFPTHRANENALLTRPVTEGEYESALNWLDIYGLENGWAQEYSSRNCYKPDFYRDDPFERTKEKD